MAGNVVSFVVQTLVKRVTRSAVPPASGIAFRTRSVHVFARHLCRKGVSHLSRDWCYPRRARLCWTLVFAGLLTTLVWGQSSIYRKMDDQSFAALTEANGAHLDVRVAKAEGLETAVQIYTGRFTDSSFSFKKYEVKKMNERRALIPYFQLSPSFKEIFLKTLWPGDALKGDVWHHRVTFSGFETLWSLSQWFTGTGQNHRIIQKASGLRSSAIHKDQILKIPGDVLFDFLHAKDAVDVGQPNDPVFTYDTPVQEEVRLMAEAKPRVTPAGDSKPIEQTGQQAPPKPQVSNEPEETAELSSDMVISGKTPEIIVEQWTNLKALRRQLKWGTDSEGRYAMYRLKSGEAIYSAVVVRFCGLVKADDVNRVAEIIIKRNRIRDETDLAIGTAIRIPYDYLEPEFKEANDPEYVDYVRNLREVSLVQTDVQTRNLEGVCIILDPGHGGRDPGASQPRFGPVWEDDFVYDIACRIKKRLDDESSATVIFTMIDPSIKYQAQDVERFYKDTDEYLLTKPKFRLDHYRVSTDGVNLRWVYANHRYQEWLNQGVKPENVLFASIHADSLHHSIRGTMIYVPDARAFPTKFRTWADRYRKYEEFAGNQFEFRSEDLKLAQARSMAFASNLIETTRNAGVRVHQQQPIRTVIHRNPNRSYVPAVVKYNRIPTRCLLEVCNLNNKQDRELIKRPEFRQQIADIFVEAVYRSYGVKGVQSLSRLTKINADR